MEKIITSAESALESTKIVMNLLAACQGRGYIGEPVSQLEHSLQGAHWARRANAASEVVLAILLHDIGHICAAPDAPQMEGLGVMHHEDIGADFLLGLGFSQTVAELVRGHVQAKRYLVSKNEGYADKLSEASLQTLRMQGGPMTKEEALAFEADPLFKDKLRMRHWDDIAKRTDLEVAGLETYEPVIVTHLQRAKDLL